MVVGGEKIFNAAHTITNEAGEVRCLNFVMTKSNAATDPIFSAIRTSLDTYGHSQPTLFYTDNVGGDMNMLTSAFPSLKAGLATDPAALPRLELPTLPGGQRQPITLLRGAASIDGALRHKYQEAQARWDNDGQRTSVAIDMEWPVELGASSNAAADRTVAVIQLCWPDQVIQLFHVSMTCRCSATLLADFMF